METASRLVIRETLQHRVVVFLFAGVLPLALFIRLISDPRVPIAIAGLMLLPVAYAVLNLLAAGQVEVENYRKIVIYKAWGRKFRRKPLHLPFSSFSSVTISLRHTGRGQGIYEIGLKRRGGPSLLIERSCDDDHAQQIADPLSKHTGLPIDSMLSCR